MSSEAKMSIQDAYKGLEDRVNIKQDDKKVIITAIIDKDKLEKAGGNIDSYSVSFANNIYQKSTSGWGNFWDWLIGADGNTCTIEANDKTFTQKGNIKYNSIGDGIIKYAKNTTYLINVDKATGTATMTFECDANGYADRIAADTLYALHDSKERLKGGKKEDDEGKGADEGAETKPKTIDDTVEGGKKEIPKDHQAEFQKFYDGMKAEYDQILKDPYTVYEKIFLPRYEKQKAAAEAAQKAAEDEEKKAPEITKAENLNDKKGKDDDVKKK
jgi:hypothetical protein